MGRPKKIKKDIMPDEVYKEVLSVPLDEKVNIHPLTQEFGNGELNILRDKVNEIIKGI